MTLDQKERFVSLFMIKIPYNMVLGKFYLSVWKNKTKAEFHYNKCFDYLKVLMYHNGELSNDDKSSINDLIELISLSIDNKELIKAEKTDG